MTVNPPASRMCPVCRGSRAAVLYRQKFEQLSGSRLLNGYNVTVCRECGAGFADGIPEQEVFDAYYRDQSKYDDRDHGTAPPVVEQRFHDIAGLIAKFISSPETRLLEIGSASGGLLEALRQRGFRDLTGSDPSPACVRTAYDFFGVPGVVGTVFTVPRPVSGYEFLVLTGVMEHIRDLERTVERFHHLLAAGGRVFLEVPDASRYAPELDAPFQEFSLEHINFFSQVSLANLMRTRGFSVLETGQTVRPLHEVTCPCVYGVFEKSADSSPIEYDNDTERGLRNYIEGCGAEDERICSEIRDCLPPGERMIVWGVGAHTLRLLATGGLEPSRIALFVDSSPRYQNQELRGVRIASPAELQNREEPILISSRSSQREIQHQVRDVMGLRNPLILLYHAPTEAHRGGAY